MNVSWIGLVRQEDTGEVIFRFDFPDEEYADGMKLCVAYGKPIGSAFNTTVEIWICTPTACIRWFPFMGVVANLQALLKEHMPC
jgi:hypothetical protein